VTKLPWEYLFEPFSGTKFPDLFRPVWVSSLILLLALVILFNVRTRALHNHQPYIEMYEWLLWTGLITFSLLLVFCLFVWDFLFVVVTMIGGVAVLLWIRFYRFRPVFEGYARKLARERYFTRSKFAHPESTIRTKSARTAKPAKAVRTRSTKRRRRR
jgi:phosphatidylglycerophosphate synthase